MPVRGRKRSIVKPFPKEKQLPWKKQQLFMKLSDFRQEIREPYLYGKARSIYSVAKFSPR